ncbi:hypothetical protein GW17_00049171 [Ensete ventricosum]|nr:hypothetical protein GW17_00049171 [Ensete ventricosum]
MEVIITSRTESLLHNKASYTCSLSHTSDKLRSFKSYLRWMCVDQTDSRHIIVS